VLEQYPFSGQIRACLDRLEVLNKRG
jgi:hypothetical protein